MKATLDKLAADALQLPTQDRAALAQVLLHSLDAESVDDPAEVRREWEAEIERRVDQVLTGRVEEIPAEEALARLRAKYG